MNENIDKLVSFSRDVLSEKIKINSQELSDELAEVVRFHEWRYYTLNEPILSDTEYDFLFKALEAIEAAHPEWRSDHSPTQRVGLEITENAKQIDHLQPMLSLANSYNEKDLVDFDLQIKKLLKLDVDEEITYSVEPKYDGGGISLVYEGNQLLRAVTRGDGSRGEEITNNVKSMKSVPALCRFR
jgi:DNA ligase (NAD+)